MALKKAIQQAGHLGTAALQRSKEAFSDGLETARSTIRRSSLLARITSSSSFDDELADERHYFLIPDRTAESNYTLCVFRCLPPGVPPINDLEKRRVLHLPSIHAEATLREIVRQQASTEARVAEADTPLQIDKRLGNLANEIDHLEGKLFGGAIMIGGLVALANPVAGAALAAKALAPSIGLLLSKHGLRMASEGASGLDVSRRVRQAEKQVKKDFEHSGTRGLINPVLAQLDEALDTRESEYDALLQFDPEEIRSALEGSGSGRDPQRTSLPSERLLELTCQAVADVYAPILGSRSKRKQARLGAEDVRFLEHIRDRAALADRRSSSATPSS